jgi:hypothetical protein
MTKICTPPNLRCHGFESLLSLCTLFSSAYDFLNSAVLPVVVGLVADLNAAAEVDCKATVIVTPLISLLNDQIANLAKFVCIFSLSFSRHV